MFKTPVEVPPLPSAPEPKPEPESKSLPSTGVATGITANPYLDLRRFGHTGLLIRVKVRVVVDTG